MMTLLASLDRQIPKPRKDIGCQQLLKNRVSRCGFLRKQPDSKSAMLLEIFGRKWPTKYVVLSCGCLYIYGSELSDKYERAASLFGYDRIEPEPDTNGLLWTFKVTNNLEDQPKVFRFAASSEDEQTAWIESFSNEILTSNAPLLKATMPGNMAAPVLRNAESVTSRLTDQNKKSIRESVNISELDYVIMEGPNDDDADSKDIYNEIDEPKTALPTSRDWSSPKPSLTNNILNVKRNEQCSPQRLPEAEQPADIYDDVSQGWSSPKHAQTNNSVDVKRNEQCSPSRVTEQDTEHPADLYDDVLGPLSNVIRDPPRQPAMPATSVNLASRANKPLPPTPQCSDVYEDDLPPPDWPAPPVPSSTSVPESCMRPRFSVSSSAILSKPELCGVVSDKTRPRPPSAPKKPSSLLANQLSPAASNKSSPPAPVPPPPPKKPSIAGGTNAISKPSFPPMLCKKSPSSPDLRPQFSPHRVLPPPVATKPHQTQGSSVEMMGDFDSPKPALPRRRQMDTPGRNRMSENNVFTNGRSCLIYEEPEYENRALVLTSPNACPISEEECLADSFVREAFYRVLADRSIEILSSCDMEGVFLIRNSLGRESSFKTLAVRTHVPDKRIVKYLIIKSQDGAYRIQWSDAKLFKSLASLLQHYQEHVLPYASTTLSKPYRQVWRQ